MAVVSSKLSVYSKEKSSVFILTLVWPIVGLILSLSNWRKPWAKNIFWLFCTFMGAIFIYSPYGSMLGEGADGGRYVLDLYSFVRNNTSLSDIFGDFLKTQTTMDLYKPLVTLFVSKVFANGHFLFFVYASIFGFFYSRNIWYVLERLPQQFDRRYYLIIAILFLLCPIWYINGVRMYTAVHVFIYGLLPCLVENNKSKLIWVALAPMFHFSFFYVSIIALVFCFLPLKWKSENSSIFFVLYILYIISLLMQSLDVQVLAGYLHAYSPEVYEERIDIYTSDTSIERMNAVTNVNWYVSLSGQIVQWTTSLFMILLYPAVVNKYTKYHFIRGFFMWCLIFGIISNIMASVPSGGRFLTIAYMFIVSLCLFVVTDTKVNILYIVPIVFYIRIGFDYVGYPLIIGNFFTLPFFEGDVPLIEFIKGLI